VLKALKISLEPTEGRLPIIDSVRIGPLDIAIFSVGFFTEKPWKND
jgi:hypothetical protein